MAEGEIKSYDDQIKELDDKLEEFPEYKKSYVPMEEFNEGVEQDKQALKDKKERKLKEYERDFLLMKLQSAFQAKGIEIEIAKRIEFLENNDKEKQLSDELELLNGLNKLLIDKSSSKEELYSYLTIQGYIKVLSEQKDLFSELTGKILKLDSTLDLPGGVFGALDTLKDQTIISSEVSKEVSEDIKMNSEVNEKLLAKLTEMKAQSINEKQENGEVERLAKQLSDLGNYNLSGLANKEKVQAINQLWTVSSQQMEKYYSLFDYGFFNLFGRQTLYKDLSQYFFAKYGEEKSKDASWFNVDIEVELKLIIRQEQHLLELTQQFESYNKIIADKNLNKAHIQPLTIDVERNNENISELLR